MTDLLRDAQQLIAGGADISRETARQLARWPDQEALWNAADAVRRHCLGNQFHLCSIINARSGGCSEDCRFCAQSARHRTGAPVYAMIDEAEALAIARDNDAHGVHRLSLVASGRAADQQTLGRCRELYARIRQETNMQCCASLGLLDQARATQLAAMGVSRYHCNLETNQQRFGAICSTHSWQDKVATLKTAAAAGLSLCSGGIIGMGESMDERIELALELRQLGIRSIPINILTPIAGTPFADLEPLPAAEVLTTVALFRCINPQAVIRIAGGRRQLAADQHRCFAAGANGAIVGNYLTTLGCSIAEDLACLRAMGFSFDRTEHYAATCQPHCPAD